MVHKKMPVAAGNAARMPSQNAWGKYVARSQHAVIRSSAVFA
jgi:hypothetical protein